MVMTAFPRDPVLDLSPWVGQRRATFSFRRYDGRTMQFLGNLNPLREPAATITHNIDRLSKRTLSMTLPNADARVINPASDRIVPFMHLAYPDGVRDFPLGRFMFTKDSRERQSSGEIASITLSDETFMIEQKLVKGLIINGSVPAGIAAFLSDYRVQIKIEPTPFNIRMSWAAGTDAGTVIETLALTGDYFSPWFDHYGKWNYIRSFNGSLKVPDLDWDRGNQVVSNTEVYTTDLLTAPNRFIVTSNQPSSSSSDTGSDESSDMSFADSTPVTAIAYVAANAPHSFENRGFYITKELDTQIADPGQAIAMAQNVADRATLIETVTIETAPDPRHDSYNVIYWKGQNWLETGWELTCMEGVPMAHTLRRTYRSNSSGAAPSPVAPNEGN